jgi:hypothetical protein
MNFPHDPNSERLREKAQEAEMSYCPRCGYKLTEWVIEQRHYGNRGMRYVARHCSGAVLCWSFSSCPSELNALRREDQSKCVTTEFWNIEAARQGIRDFEKQHARGKLISITMVPAE